MSPTTPSPSTRTTRSRARSSPSRSRSSTSSELEHEGDRDESPLSEGFDPGSTVSILLEAGRREPAPTLLADAGVENRTQAVDELVDSGVLQRVLARTEISFSNSLIEAWWRSLKHQWLYVNSLDSVDALRRRTEFYVEEHNTRLPHSAFQGQTPDEMYFGTGEKVPEELAALRAAARAERLTKNRSVACDAGQR